MSTMEGQTDEACIQEESQKTTKSDQQPSHKVKQQEIKPKSIIKLNLRKCLGRCTGDWYDRMLECQRCKQWFHDTCVGYLNYRLIHGDGFYLYVCEYCNNGREFLHRLPVNWEDIVHLALWNLTISKYPSRNSSFFDYKEEIYPWVNDHWEFLQCPTELLSTPSKDRTKHILSALEGNAIKFRCGKEFHKKVSTWKLRSRNPPTIPDIILPPERPFTEAMMHRISYCERAKELPPIPKTFKIETAETDKQMNLKQQLEESFVMDEDKKEDNKNGSLEFNTHVCLRCKSCIDGLDEYVIHIKNGCVTAEEEEQNILEDLKKKEYQLKKELSSLKMNVVEREGQLKDIQNKILRHEKTGHKVKTAQLKIKTEEVAISKKELKQLKLKYNKLLCYLKEHEHEIDQTEKKGDTPEKINDKKSPKAEKKISSSKSTSVKFSDKSHSPEKREILKEKNRLIIHDSLFKKSKKDKKEQKTVIDANRQLLENPLSKLSCSETVSTNLKESSVVGINPKHSKTNKNELIKDEKPSANKIKHDSNKPDKSSSLEPISESNQFQNTKDELTSGSLEINIKQNIAHKAKDSFDLYRKTDKSSDDTTKKVQSPCIMSKDYEMKMNQSKDREDISEKTLLNIQKNAKSININSQQSTIEFVNSQQSITIADNKVDNAKPDADLGKPLKPALKTKVALSKDSECSSNIVKVENVEHQSPIATKDANNNNESVVFLEQIQLPPNNVKRAVPRVSTPICKAEKLDFVDPELSAIISGEETSHGIDDSVYLLSTNIPRESEGNSPLNEKSPKTQELEPLTSNKEKNNDERVKSKVKFKNASSEQKLKDQAKDESHNEAMILETDLDNDVCKVDKNDDNNSNQCQDNNSNVSIYSPQDTVETISLSGSEFLTVSETTKSHTKADVSISHNYEKRTDPDKNVSNSKKDHLSQLNTNESEILKDVETSSGKSSKSNPISEEAQGLKKENVNYVEKLTAATRKPETAKTSTSTLSKGSSGSQRQKITMEKTIDKVEKSENTEKLPTATVKPLNTAPTKLSKDEASRRDKRKLHPDGNGSKEKRTRINSTNANDGLWHPSNYRRGGSNSATYQGDRFHGPNYDHSHHPRSGVLRVPYQRPNRPPWLPRGTNNYRPRGHNQNHYNWNYRW